MLQDISALTVSAMGLITAVRDMFVCLFVVMLAERLRSNGTTPSLSTLEQPDITLDGAVANGEDSSDGSEKMTRSKRRKRTRVSR